MKLKIPLFGSRKLNICSVKMINQCSIVGPTLRRLLPGNILEPGGDCYLATSWSLAATATWQPLGAWRRLLPGNLFEPGGDCYLATTWSLAATATWQPLRAWRRLLPGNLSEPGDDSWLVALVYGPNNV